MKRIISFIKEIFSKRKSGFKYKDWVLTTGIEGGEWTLCQYSHFSAGGNHVFVGGTRSKICIPFNRSTKHLLGTKLRCKG